MVACGTNSRRRSGHSRDVAARPAEAADNAVLHQIEAGDEYDWYPRGGGFRCAGCSEAGAREDHRHLTVDQVGRQFRQPITLIVRPAIFNRYVPTLDIAVFV